MYQRHLNDTKPLLSILDMDVEHTWHFSPDSIRSADEEIVGLRTRTKQPWMSDETFKILSLKADVSIYLSIGINVRFAAMMADVGDGLL